MSKNNISIVRNQHSSNGVSVQVKIKLDELVSQVLSYGLDAPDKETVIMFVGLVVSDQIQYYAITMDEHSETVIRVTTGDLPAVIKHCYPNSRLFNVTWQPGYAGETVEVEEKAVF